MTKRMLIDATRQEETRVVVLDGNKLEDVEFESENRKQIKGNIYLAKVVRIEPSLQAAFVDYGGNKHGFLAFSEIHPDYYNIPEKTVRDIEKEVDEIIEAKKQQIREREQRREQSRRAYEEELARQQQIATENETDNAVDNTSEENNNSESFTESNQDVVEKNTTEVSEQPSSEEQVSEENIDADKKYQKDGRRRRMTKSRKQITDEIIATVDFSEQVEKLENASDIGEIVIENEIDSGKDVNIEQQLEHYQDEQSTELVAENEQTEETVSDNTDENAKGKKFHVGGRRRKNAKSDKLKVMSQRSSEDEYICENVSEGEIENEQIDDDENDFESDFEAQRKLMILRKMYYGSTIQDVIKEGQILLVQVLKEERGNKGAALTTYLSLAGKYCVLMPNRIKSGGVSRKITVANDRKRLKDILKSLPLSSDMSMIIRTAGEEKTKQDITRDYNYLMRTWNQIRNLALTNKAPLMVYEEGNLVKRALRDMYTKEISEVLIDGEKAYRTAKEFVKIYSPNQLKKIKCSHSDDIPLFQRFQVENQLDKLHNPIVQLESGGYLVINPTEALVSIDVNSGRATKEKDIEETALNTNLEAADEIARQLRMRDLAGLVVVDFIDMEEPQNNHAVEKRMKEAMKNDRAKVQIAKMSCFGLLEISRQRLHSSFIESNYVVCPHCNGTGMVRTLESAGLYILREIEEEGIKNRFSRLNISVPYDSAIYLLNQKKKSLYDLEKKYDMEIVISADETVKNIADYKIERIKLTKTKVEDEVKVDNEDDFEQDYEEDDDEYISYEKNNYKRDRRHRFDRNRGRFWRNKNHKNNYAEDTSADKPKGKVGWWRRLLGKM